MTTVREILASARAKVATLAPTRDAALLFKEHLTNQPFAKSPISKNDGFEVVAQDEANTMGFGQAETKEESFTMVVRLGHSPASTDDDREDWRSRDRERLTDLLERHVYPTGTMAVIYDRNTCDKSVANWWVTEIWFTVLFRGAIATS